MLLFSTSLANDMMSVLLLEAPSGQAPDSGYPRYFK
jgi:hypothetical protein